MTTQLKRKTNRKRFVDVFALKAHDRAAGRVFRREKKKSRTKLFPFLPCCDFQDASSHSLLLPRGQHPPNFIPLSDPRGAVSGWAGLTPEKGFAPHLQLCSETLWGALGGPMPLPLVIFCLHLPLCHCFQPNQHSPLLQVKEPFAADGKPVIAALLPCLGSPGCPRPRWGGTTQR